MSPCSPRGVALAGRREKRGCRGAALGPGARWEGLGRRWSPPPRPFQQRPGARRLLPGCMPASAWRSRPESEPRVLPQPRGSGGAAGARETTAESGCSGQPPPSPGPRPPPPPPPPPQSARRREVRLRAEGRGWAGSPGRGRGARRAGPAGRGRERRRRCGLRLPCPPRPHLPASAPVEGWAGGAHAANGDFPKPRPGQGGAGDKCGDPRGASKFPNLPLGCPGEHVSIILSKVVQGSGTGAGSGAVALRFLE